MSNQDIEGDAPAGAAPGAPAGTPEYFEQQLAKERDARTQMRDRLRHTEALAAESHALRSRMAQELERVTADRDRLRSATAAAPGAAAGAPMAAPAAMPTPRLTDPPPFVAGSSDAPLKPPTPPRRSGPWLALAMLGVLAAGVAGFAWYSGTLPGASETASTSAPSTSAPSVASVPIVAPAATVVAATPVAPAVTAAATATTPAPAPVARPDGAVALPPLTPEQVLAAAPAAAGSAAAMTPAGMAARLRTALDGEGISSPVDIDAATGHVMVADPASDDASRDRTDLVIRAVYAGASLPEPRIEHRWLSPMRGARASQASAATSAPAPAQDAAAAYAARHAAAQRHRVATDVAVTDAEELRPVLPAGRVNASCKAGLSGTSTAHRNAEMTACMKHSCCSSANRQTEECRAWNKAYPFTCSAG